MKWGHIRPSHWFLHGWSHEIHKMYHVPYYMDKEHLSTVKSHNNMFSLIFEAEQIGFRIWTI